MLASSDRAVSTTAHAPAFTQILVPLSASPASRHAVDRAIALARASGATLHLLRVIADDAEAPDALIGLCEAERAAAQRGVAAVTELRRGEVVDEVLLAAAYDHADLIVVGTHGRSPSFVPAVGDTTVRLLRTSTVPVMVIR